MIEFKSNPNFIEWFAGFVDAEGCFHIKRKIMSNGKIRYYFEFTIKLHIDHEPLLRAIKITLDIGRIAVRSNSNSCSFEVGSEKELRILLGLLDKTTLMGTKYLDYISFSKAFFLYFDRSGLVTESLIAEIEKLRESHNTNRTEFGMPVEYNCVITDYKLLGLIEGDGSFIIQKKDLIPKFELELTSTQKPLLVAIQSYLIINLGLDKSYQLSGRLPKIKVRDLQAKSNSKPTVRLEITGVDLLHNHFNVFLSKLKFFSDKRKDFEDFCLICKTLDRKAHINNKQVKDILLKLANGMNSARLSTSKNREVQILTKEEIMIIEGTHSIS